ncbi:heme exporter protein CcmB [Salmonella enterica]|uniref:heme exporter protein CcmB n=1 Tax=Salmonella enterica TaxID=28901 RepID=UPI0039DFAEAF
MTLFPLSVGPQPQLLARIAPGIIQVAALLASLSSVSSCAWRSATARTSPARCGSS